MDVTHKRNTRSFRGAEPRGVGSLPVCAVFVIVHAAGLAFGHFPNRNIYSAYCSILYYLIQTLSTGVVSAHVLYLNSTRLRSVSITFSNSVVASVSNKI